MLADLLVAETHDDLEVTLGLVQKQPWEDLGRGNDQLWTSPTCVGLQHLPQASADGKSSVCVLARATPKSFPKASRKQYIEISQTLAHVQHEAK